MKRYATIAVTFAALALPGAASAHTLTWQRAEQRSAIEAKRFVSSGDTHWYTDCERGRRSAHEFNCIIATYDRGTDITCDAYVTVRFRNSRSYRTVAGPWRQIDCGSGDPYNLVATFG